MRPIREARTNTAALRYHLTKKPPPKVSGHSAKRPTCFHLLHRPALKRIVNHAVGRLQFRGHISKRRSPWVLSCSNVPRREVQYRLESKPSQSVFAGSQKRGW